jgi:hypothetical protein
VKGVRDGSERREGEKGGREGRERREGEKGGLRTRVRVRLEDYLTIILYEIEIDSEGRGHHADRVG